MDKYYSNQPLNKNTLCHICFSANRKMYSSEKYVDILSTLCHDIKLPISMTICWECNAILQKIRRFKYKIKNSQKIMKTFYCSNTLPASVSSFHTVLNDSLYNTYIEYIEENIEIKPMCIKNEDESDFNDNDTNFINSVDEFNKIPLVKEIYENNINKIKTKRKRYEYMTCIRKHDVKMLTKMIKIGYNEIKVWQENEKRSKLFERLNFKCHSCVSGWQKEKHLLEHNRKCHNNMTSFSCNTCCRGFSSRRRLSRHILSHLMIMECRICSEKYSFEMMKTHLATHKGLLKCLECDSIFINLRNFNNHYKNLHSIFICDNCGKKCKSKRVLVKHMSRHYEKFECKTCERHYKSRATYNKHMNLKHAPSTGEDQYCVQCDKRFDNASLYKRHVRSSTAHASERDANRIVKRVSCPSCSRVYSRRSYMMNHYRHVHMKQSKYRCQICEKHFLNRTKFVDHMKYKHEGVEKLKNKLCNICGRGFTSNQILAKHIRTHSGERPFVCCVCDAKFTQKHAMLSHITHVHDKRKLLGQRTF